MQFSLVQTTKKIPTSNDWQHEVKWDGIRVMVIIDEKSIQLLSKSKLDITARFPELNTRELFDCNSAIMDGEMICPLEDGRPDFPLVMKRFRSIKIETVHRLSKRLPVLVQLFDLMELDKVDLTSKPLIERQELLRKIVDQSGNFKIPEVFDDGKELWKVVKKSRLEGIVSKRKDSSYRPGIRTPDWVKIKNRSSSPCVIIGYSTSFAYFAEIAKGGLMYRGSLEAGKKLLEKCRQLKQLSEPHFALKKPPKLNAQWVDPKITLHLSHGLESSLGTWREPAALSRDY